MSEHNGPALCKMVGRVFTSVSADEFQVTFVEADGSTWTLCDDAQCCSEQALVDVNGDLADLVGEPLLSAAEESDDDGLSPPGSINRIQDSYSWTFYKFHTKKGYVTVSWFGTSNGCYSEKARLEHQEGRAEP